MELNKQTLLSLMVVTSLVAVPSVSAQEMNQEQTLSQDCEVVCEVGAYGQNTTCTNRCSQEGSQSQSITLSNGTVLAAHEPINTGLDFNTTTAMFSFLSTGILAVVARKKLV